MVNLFSSESPHISFFPSSGTILLVVWSANGDGSALTSEANSKVNLLNDNTDGIVCHPSAKYSKKSLEHTVVELVYKFDEKSYCEGL